MMDRVFWINHNGKRILFTDYANLDKDELIKVVEWSIEEVFPRFKACPPGSIRSLVDVTGTTASKAGVHALKNVEALWKPLYLKQAIIGLTAFHQIFLHAVNKAVGSAIVAFKTREEALDWLVED